MRFDSAAVGKFERRRNAWSVNGRINRLSSRLGGTGNSQSFKVSGTRSRDDEIRPDIASLTSLQSRAFSSPRSACHGANVFVIRHTADCEKLPNRIYIYIQKYSPAKDSQEFSVEWNSSFVLPQRLFSHFPKCNSSSKKGTRRGGQILVSAILRKSIPISKLYVISKKKYTIRY